MAKRYFLVLILVASLLGLAGILTISPDTASRGTFQTLSSELTNEEFWRIVNDFSEADGYFRFDNLLSNELRFQHVIPDLLEMTEPGHVYLGVGPEQNFTYIAALQPSMAFIIDIRRGNLQLHLMYKALFELSEDRAEFVSRLFGRPRPEELGPEASVRSIFDAYLRAVTNEEWFRQNVREVQHHLVSSRGFALSEEDLRAIEDILETFYWFGPRINYTSSTGGGFAGSNWTSYAELMTTDDGSGERRSYLASEENFKYLKSLQARNLIVPVVGDFAGSKAIRAVATYLKERDALVSAFYVSNVEQYLFQDGIWSNFCRNVATLPVNETSTFIRAVRSGGFGFGTGFTSQVARIMDDIGACTIFPQTAR